MAGITLVLESRDDLAMCPILHLPPRPDTPWDAAEAWHPASMRAPAEPPVPPELTALAEAVEVDEVELVETDEPFLDAAERAKVGAAGEGQDKRPSTKKKGACAARPRQNAIEGALAGVGTYDHVRTAGATAFAEAALPPLHLGGGGLGGVGFAAPLMAAATWGLAPWGASGSEVPADPAALAENVFRLPVGSGGMGPPAMGFAVGAAVPSLGPMAEAQAAIARFAEPLAGLPDAAWPAVGRPVVVDLEAASVPVTGAGPRRDDAGAEGGQGVPAVQAATSHAPVEAIRAVAATDAGAGPPLAGPGTPGPPLGPVAPRAADGVEIPRQPAAAALPEVAGATRPALPPGVGDGTAIGLPGKDIGAPAPDADVAQLGRAHEAGGKAAGLAAAIGDGPVPDLNLAPPDKPDDAGGGKAAGLPMIGAPAPDAGAAPPGKAHGHGKDSPAEAMRPSLDALPAAQGGGVRAEPVVEANLSFPASPPPFADSHLGKAGQGGKGKADLAADADAGPITPPGHAEGHRGPRAAEAVPLQEEAGPGRAGIPAALPGEGRTKAPETPPGLAADETSVLGLDPPLQPNRGLEHRLEPTATAGPKARHDDPDMSEPPGQAHRPATPASAESPDRHAGPERPVGPNADHAAAEAKHPAADATPAWPVAEKGGSARPPGQGDIDPSPSFTVTGLMDAASPSPAGPGRAAEAPAVPLSDLLADWNASVLQAGRSNDHRAEHVQEPDPGPMAAAASPDPSWHGGRPPDAGHGPHPVHDWQF